MQEIIKIDTPNNAYLSNLDKECYILSSNLDDSYCTSIINKALNEKKIILFYGDDAVNKAQKLKASGVVVRLKDDKLKPQMESLKKELGKNSIIGLFSRNRRHEAMLTSELEPDFIIFKVWKEGLDKTLELLSWYNDFFLIQSCAWLEDDDIDLSLINTDFIIK